MKIRECLISTAGSRQAKFFVILLFLGQVLFLTACGGGTKPQIETPVTVVPPSTPQAGTLPPDELGSYLQAIQLIDKQDYESAEKMLVKLSRRNASVAGVWANLAIAHYLQNDTANAESTVKRAYQLNDNDAEILNLMGLLAVKRGDFKSAEAHYKKAIELKNEFANAHYNLALLFDIYYQDIASAYEYYNRYLSLTGGQDQETADWVEQLKYSLERE